jgi:hypothetical protein
MALQAPQTRKGSIRENALEYEIVQEQAAALGRLGRTLEAALRTLSAYDAGKVGSGGALSRPLGSLPASRKQLLEEAGYALWCFIVQREACGLRDQEAVVREYRVPIEVRNRVGVCAGDGSRLVGR